MKGEELIKKIKKSIPDFPDGLNPVVWLLGYRKVSFRVIKWLVRTKITPNQITYFEIIIFLVSILLIGTGRHLFMIAGAIIGILCIYLDYIDGDLARAKSLTSEFGHKLDAVNDHLAAILLPISMTSAVFIQTNHKYILILGAIIIFNTYMSKIGQRSILEKEDPKKESPKNKGKSLNRIQKEILHLTGVRIGCHTLWEVDTRLFVFWLGCLFNQLFLVLIYYLIYSIYEVINTYFRLNILYKD